MEKTQVVPPLRPLSPPAWKEATPGYAEQRAAANAKINAAMWKKMRRDRVLTIRMGTHEQCPLLGDVMGAALALSDGDIVYLVRDMGSCQCGDTGSRLIVRYGGVWAICTGSRDWQMYDGPAAKCEVPYGVGLAAQLIADTYAGTFDAAKYGELLPLTWGD